MTGFRALTGIESGAKPGAGMGRNRDPAALDRCLILIEDMTGGGKTEAASCTCPSADGDRRADGIYFALPTMATANAMFVRVEEIRRGSMPREHGRPYAGARPRRPAPSVVRNLARRQTTRRKDR